MTPSLAHREGAVSIGSGQVLGHLRIHSQILNREHSVQNPSLAHREGAVSIGSGQVLGHLRIHAQILNQGKQCTVSSVADPDPGSGVLTPWIRDPIAGMEKNPDLG